MKGPPRPHPYVIVLSALLLAAVAISVVAGSPDQLPGVAMESCFLFYLERAFVIFAGGVVLTLVLIEAWKGNLPTEISEGGIKYERFREETQAALEALTEALAEERKERELREQAKGQKEAD